LAHVSGVAVVPLAGSGRRDIAAPADITLGGFDGLYVAGDLLFGVQNGLGTSRVIRVELDPQHSAALRTVVLESAHPALETPTTAAVVLGERRLLVLVPGDHSPSTILSVPIDL
jgi:hypothetical protein